MEESGEDRGVFMLISQRVLCGVQENTGECRGSTPGQVVSGAHPLAYCRMVVYVIMR
uniref:Uncharacterized protein n=1 Tax=Candidatus Methanogaster sp. ANME-2c ERB4 TaxID=2759911 RepID=A0A7G9YEA1_9EURY|nr:hypothetical protein PABHDKJJ_00039 [Methanosarcinales archaeon ANME-2c ERB4]